jgi:hypothetical protein
MEATMEHVKGQEHSQSQTVHWRIFIIAAILSLTGLFCTPQLDAKIYQWIDENGVKHYSNSPPANAGNAKIVFDEYEHDEAADHKRVKTDQKEMDALTEKIKKEEEQQASVEEQKKLEEAQQNQPHLFASGCFSPSYSIQQGRGVNEVVIPKDLMEGEYQDLQKLFQGLDGVWSGNARVFGCPETPDERREQIDNYSIKSKGTMQSTGQFVLESDMYSMEKRHTEHKILRLYLSEEKLAKQPNIKVADIELISVSSNELVYVEKGQSRSGSGALLVREIVTTIKKSGEASFTLERVFYVNGRLISKSIWHLERV